MNYIFTLFLLLAGVSVLQAQDIIVRITGDTLHVKIDHSNDQFVYYRSETTKRNELDVISRMEVSSILYNYESADKSLKGATIKDRGYDPFEIWFLYGYYFLPIDNSGSTDFDDYYKDLQNGRGFMAGAQYFVSKSIGFGLCYSLSQFSNTIGNAVYKPTGQTGNISDNMAIQYVGAGIVARLPVPKIKSYFEIKAGVGYTFYKNMAQQIEPYTLTANGPGGHLGVQFTISVGNGLFIPIQGGVNGFEVKNIRAEIPNSTSELGMDLQRTFEAATSLKVTRLSISAGLQYVF